MESVTAYKTLEVDGQKIIARVSIGTRVVNAVGTIFYVWDYSDNPGWFIVVDEKQERSVIHHESMFIPPDDYEFHAKLYGLFKKNMPHYGEDEPDHSPEVKVAFSVGKRVFTHGRVIPGAKWDGADVKATEMIVVVGDSGHPNYWAKGFIGMRRRAVKCVRDKQIWYLDDEDGQGYVKVTLGQGSMGYGHRTLYVSEEVVMN